MARPNSQALLLGRYMGTGSKAHEVHGVGHRVRFVKVVDSPDQPPFAVSPGSKIFKVQIAHCKQKRRYRRFSGYFAPNLRPPVKRGTKEWKKTEGHLLMLERKCRAIQRDAGSHPLFVILRRLVNIHLMRLPPQSFLSVATVSESGPARALDEQRPRLKCFNLTNESQCLVARASAWVLVPPRTNHGRLKPAPLEFLRTMSVR